MKHRKVCVVGVLRVSYFYENDTFVSEALFSVSETLLLIYGTAFVS